MNLHKANLGKPTFYSGIIIEFKSITDEGEVESALQDALNQIVKKEYAAELHDRKISDNLAVGVVFCGKKVAVGGMVLK